MKILVCCGNGLGSSFMMEMNINNILKELNVSGVEVDHSDLGSAKGTRADVYVATRDLVDQLSSVDGKIISLNNMLDKNELKEKVTELLKEKGII